MKTILCSILLGLAFVPTVALAASADDAELRKQRLEAQKERNDRVRERNTENNQAGQAFRRFSSDLKAEYRQQVQDLDTEYRLQQVDLKADHQARVTSAETQYQTKLSALFTNPAGEMNDELVQRMRADAKMHSDKMFELKKQSAEELHQARIANEERKNALLTERDQMALDEAESLGLTRSFSPVLASPIGGQLTASEQRWNEREKKEVVRMEERNYKLLSEFRNGAELRKWEIENLNTDFNLTWEEKAKLHAVDSELGFYNTLFMQAIAGGQVDQQKMMADIAKLNEKKKLINIEYRKIRDKSRITRREERKGILDK